MNCWFCSIREEETGHELAIEMYGEVVANETAGQTKVAYKVNHIVIPRCTDCHSRHRIARSIDVFSIMLGIIFLGLIIIAVFGLIPEWAWALWMGLSLGLLLGLRVARSLTLKGIHSIHDAKTIFPEVKALVEKCYRFGIHPKGEVTESDPPCNSDDERQL